ncbi:lysophospholipid acyltransferase LPEAT1-like isoform X4 [Diospyros lotus]|uniref:lysophospholipid acyltransferase LPEAT1-like isoform X4 n=1 Tax=Diospyros lotus TaxID=55363 RepID=UPI00224F334A|nr:lysophospholipid acyltransferase LPEAT1-like isoform X4 [Diospyros lotus]
MEPESDDPIPISDSQQRPPPSDPIDDGSSSAKHDQPLLGTPTPPLPVAAAVIKELEKKSAAYVRHDLYGPMGRGPLPWIEKLFLAIAFLTIVPVRVILALTLLVLYYLICRVCTLFSAPNREDGQEHYGYMGGWRRGVIVRSGRFLSRAMLFVLGFYWIKETKHSPDPGRQLNSECNDLSEESGRPGAIISNHISYLDILYHMSSSFPSFVAKWVNFLWLVSSGVVNERVREAHRNKLAPMMMLFPEGTTTNGDFLLPFKTGAFLATAPVLPLILRYPYRRFSPAWDSISGVRHVIFLLCQFVNYLEVRQLPVYHPSQQEKDNPKLYADNVRRLMAREGNLILSDIGLAEKRIYHAALNGNNSLHSVLHQKDE